MRLGSSLPRPHESNKANLGFQRILTPDKARSNFRELKVLFSIFFDANGPIDQFSNEAD